MNHGRWRRSVSFYLATVGAAVGLGNVWRFPYVVAENGGGAFVLMYFFLVFVVGVPMLIGELLLGKSTGTALIPSLIKLLKPQVDLMDPPPSSDPEPSRLKGRRGLARLRFGGPFSIVICLLVLSYYAVISGWVLNEILSFSMAWIGVGEGLPERALPGLLNQGWRQMFLATVHLSVVGFVVAKNIDEGMERWVGKVMPLLLILLIVMVYQSFSLESSEAALKFFLYPDFSKLGWSSLAQATGQVLFTLSIGFGTMVTFGSYLGDRTNVVVAGYWVAIFDLLVSLIAGFMVFPVVIGKVQEVNGPLLVFMAVPELLSKVQGGPFFGAGFFLCLYLAALGASISLLETVVANVMAIRSSRRSHSASLVAILALVLAIPVAFSTNRLQLDMYQNHGLLELLDRVLIDWCLPVAGILLSYAISKRMDRAIQQEEFEVGTSAGVAKLYGHWRFALSWLVPGIIGLGLLLQLIGLF